jgi:hypothetical protein
MEYTNRIFRVLGTVPLPDAASTAAHQEQMVQMNQTAQTFTTLVYKKDLLNLKAELATLETELTGTLSDSTETVQATISNLNSVIDYTLSKI